MLTVVPRPFLSFHAHTSIHTEEGFKLEVAWFFLVLPHPFIGIAADWIVFLHVAFFVQSLRSWDFICVLVLFGFLSLSSFALTQLLVFLVAVPSWWESTARLEQEQGIGTRIHGSRAKSLIDRIRWGGGGGSGGCRWGWEHCGLVIVRG